jgi:hypothetical protein
MAQLEGFIVSGVRRHGTSRSVRLLVHGYDLVRVRHVHSLGGADPNTGGVQVSETDYAVPSGPDNNGVVDIPTFALDPLYRHTLVVSPVVDGLPMDGWMAQGEYIRPDARLFVDL